MNQVDNIAQVLISLYNINIMATIAEIKNLISNNRFEKMKQMKPHQVFLADVMPKTDSGLLKSLLDNYFAQIEEKIITLVENILQQKLQEFEKIILERAKPGAKGDKPIMGVDYILPHHGKDADEKTIIAKVLAHIPIPEKINEKKIVDDVLRKMPKPKKEITLEELQKSIQIDASAITGLSSFVKKYVPNQYHGGGGGGGGDTIRYVDLSSSLDGSTKTFTLTRVNRVLGVFGSSFPGGGFRPTTDWTFAQSTGILTFTSQIDEATTLASGQTIWIMYVEA